MDKHLKNKRVKLRSKQDIEPQEVFLDLLSQRKEIELGVSEKKFELPISRNILQAFYIVFLILMLTFLGRTLYLQFKEGNSCLLLAADNKNRVELMRSERGVIYDQFGKQLVWNRPSFDLVLDKRDLPLQGQERDNIIKEVSKIIKKDFGELRKEIEESESPQILILENIPQDILISLETSPLFAEDSWNTGFRIEKNTVRDYVSAPLFSQLIGYMGKINKEELKENKDYSIADYIGKIGLEKSYENFLRGDPGKIQVEKDVVGNLKSRKEISQPEPGKSIVLWLDSNLQEKIESEVQLALQKTGAKRGAAVAMNPKTGGILALVSLPSFDNNLFSKSSNPAEIEKIFNDPLQPFFNLAISGEYPTGSTIKPLMASAALQEKIISPEKTIYDPGFIEVPNQYNPNIVYRFMDWKPHGTVNLRKAIAVSCNVYFYTIGGGYDGQEGLGAERIEKYLKLFGWGSETGIDLPGEKEGLIPDPTWKKENIGENWYTGDTYHLSIGQGYLTATPLQVVTAFSAIANGGILYEPRLVQKIIDSQKDTFEELKPEIIRENFIDPKNLQIVREGMRDGVTYGSSVILNDLPVNSAAKTGTAETGKENVYHNWVTVFAPYEDPQIVLTIVIENVPGAQVAALPIAKNILAWYFSKNK